MKKWIIALLLLGSIGGVLVAVLYRVPNDTVVVTPNELKWGSLNPSNPAISPQASTLWGDRNGLGASGSLALYKDGFVSPPHIHNVNYRGIVINGQIHNDDPQAARTWLSAGSMWFQPAGEVHITAAKGKSVMAYLEMDEGPYLVKPPTEAFDNGEKPLLLDAKDIAWSPVASGIQTALLWGSTQKGQPRGSLIQIPARTTAKIVGTGSTFHGVVIQGQVVYQKDTTLPTGSYFGSEGRSTHQVQSSATIPSIIYVRSDADLKITPVIP